MSFEAVGCPPAAAFAGSNVINYLRGKESDQCSNPWREVQSLKKFRVAAYYLGKEPPREASAAIKILSKLTYLSPRI